MATKNKANSESPFADNVFSLRGDKGREQRWIEIRRSSGDDTDLRHLNLYAAAPDLLEGLKAMQRAFENYGNEFNPSGKVKKLCDWGQLNEDLMKATAALEKAGVK